ncbi:helix-turn-helix transcriptional regulator [Kineococcus sp. NUM-3379]
MELGRDGGDFTVTLADRLNALFKERHPEGRGPYSTEEIADITAANGEAVSSAYIWHLRRGARDNPSLPKLAALARAFGVGIGYFFTTVAPREMHMDEALRRAMENTAVADIALRSSELSPEAQETIKILIERLHGIEQPPAGLKRIQPRPLPPEADEDDATPRG